jgi:hypothetical protein
MEYSIHAADTKEVAIPIDAANNKIDSLAIKQAESQDAIIQTIEGVANDAARNTDKLKANIIGGTSRIGADVQSILTTQQMSSLAFKQLDTKIAGLCIDQSTSSDLVVCTSCSLVQ